ncbi:MAG: hypothetical protein LH615_09295 [Ferruginibacter sp.]|nr:hypothetical protein [Ferruginibacter sp.]
MKIVFTSIFSFILLASAIAMPIDKIKIGSNSKTSSLEIRLNSTHKKSREAIVSIVNEAGKIVNSFKAVISKGENIIAVKNALGLKEGLYTLNILINKKTLSTKLMIFE